MVGKSPALDQLRKRQSQSLADELSAEEEERLNPVLLEKNTRKKSQEDDDQPVEEHEQDPQAELPLRETPTPQIIDASQRRKPSADLGAKPFGKKKQEYTGLTTDEFEDYDLPGC